MVAAPEVAAHHPGSRSADVSRPAYLVRAVVGFDGGLAGCQIERGNCQALRRQVVRAVSARRA
jgi:hypothetical protein